MGDVNGISFDFRSMPPGPGVITVRAGTNFDSIDFGKFTYGGAGAAPNQIIQGQVLINLNYVFFPSSAGAFRAYDPNPPNADTFLTSAAAHGMGHVLGLNDTPDAGNVHQTSTSIMGGQIGTNNNGAGSAPPSPRSNAPTACDQASVAAQGAANSNSSPVGTGTSSGSGGSGGPSYVGCGSGFEIWDDSTNTETYYYPSC